MNETKLINTNCDTDSNYNDNQQWVNKFQSGIGSWRNIILASAVKIIDETVIGCVDNTVSNSNISHYHVDPRVSELNRQGKRIRPYIGFKVNAEGYERRLKNIYSALSALDSFYRTPAPIPIASIDEEENSNLFIRTDRFYSDIEINDGVFEYYCKYLDESGEEHEVYDEEDETGDDALPPKLLGLIYRSFARHL